MFDLFWGYVFVCLFLRWLITVRVAGWCVSTSQTLSCLLYHHGLHCTLLTLTLHLYLFSQSQILKLEDLHKVNLALVIHKIHNNQTTGTHNLINVSNIHTHNTRLSRNNNYYTQFYGTNTGQSTYPAAGVKV